MKPAEAKRKVIKVGAVVGSGCMQLYETTLKSLLLTRLKRRYKISFLGQRIPLAGEIVHSRTGEEGGLVVWRLCGHFSGVQLHHHCSSLCHVFTGKKTFGFHGLPQSRVLIYSRMFSTYTLYNQIVVYSCERKV